MKKRTAVIAWSVVTLLGAPLITGCSPQMIMRVSEGLSESVEGIKRRIKKPSQNNVSNGEDTESDDFYFNRAYKKAEQGDYYGAISDYNKAIEINPSNAIAYHNRGSAKENLGDAKGALNDYEKALSIDPNRYLSLQGIGSTKNRMGDHYGAISAYNQSIKLNPRNAMAYNNRGIAKRKIGDDKGGCDDYKKAISLGNKETEKWFKTEGADWCRHM